MEVSFAAIHFSLAGHACGLDKAEYEIVRNSILKNLLAYGVMTPDRLGSLVEKHLESKFHGSLWRHYEAVRMDLERRGEIRRVPGSNPPLIELES